MKIYRLTPYSKSAIWGGTRLSRGYGKDPSVKCLAETWELSLHKDGQATVDGVPLSLAIPREELGENALGFDFFPTLIKFIDAEDDLSVQVHPSDEYALREEGSLGKSEMWYVVDATADACLYLGFKKDMDIEEVRSAIREDRLSEELNRIPVKKGEYYMIPSGTVHAIGKGCLIYEIQQNSNLTYRVYDYGRVDSEGKARELHIDKAMKVMSLGAYRGAQVSFESTEGEIIGMNKYFHTTRITVKDEYLFSVDKKSFRALSCTEGECELCGLGMNKGNSVLIPAGFGNVKITNKSEKDTVLIMTQIRKYYVGIDLGGTFIKGGIVDDLGNILISDKTPTESTKGSDVVSKNIATLAKGLIEKAGLTKDDVVGIGMGVPGMIDSKAGIVTYSNNLGWENFPIAKAVSELTGMPVKIANDANVAALGEVKFGGGKDYENVIMLTLGTGVGGGAVLDGKLMEGNKGAGAEFGHSCISFGGEKCTCGRRGCLEAYASATALIRDTKRAMEKHPESAMWKVAPTLDKVDGATAFSLKDKDETAKAVVDHYIEMLGTGLCNIAAVFRPEAILLGGGVCAEGDNLIVPLQKYVDENIFAGKLGPRVEIITAKLGNKAGLVGGACLLF